MDDVEEVDAVGDGRGFEAGSAVGGEDVSGEVDDAVWAGVGVCYDDEVVVELFVEELLGELRADEGVEEWEGARADKGQDDLLVSNGNLQPRADLSREWVKRGGKRQRGPSASRGVQQRRRNSCP